MKQLRASILPPPISAEEKNILYRASIASAPIWLLAVTLEYFVFELGARSFGWTCWLVACVALVALRMGTSLRGLRRKSARNHALMLASLMACGLLFTLPVMLVHPLSDPKTMLLIAVVLSIATSGAYTLAVSRIGLIFWVVPSLGSFMVRMLTMPEAMYPDYTLNLRLAMVLGCVLYGALLIALGIASSQRIRHTFQLQKSLKQASRENRRRAREAEAATRAKSEFLAMMSHEIRTPLNGVLGMAQSLHQDNLPRAQREKVSTIIDSGNSLMSILNDVLDISKIEAGKMDITAAEHDLYRKLRSIQTLFDPMARERKIDLRLEIDDSLPRLALVDAVRVRQCLSNLVSNAIKFTREGEVVITASARPIPGDPDDRFIASISVRDTGIGMDEETCQRLFATFSQGDASTTRNFGGTGLGLAISRRLARLMGGDISVDSTPGQGSVFTLTFTAQKAAQGENMAEDKTEAPADKEGSGRRVLVVDDIAVNRQVVRVFLEPAGYRVSEAANGADALSVLGAETIDLVLLDIHMPVMDGYETIRRLRASKAPWAAVPVIALTADAMAGDREKLLASGMNAYVSKPIDRRDLLQAVSEALRVNTTGSRPVLRSTA